MLTNEHHHTPGEPAYASVAAAGLAHLRAARPLGGIA